LKVCHFSGRRRNITRKKKHKHTHKNKACRTHVVHVKEDEATLSCSMQNMYKRTNTYKLISYQINEVITTKPQPSQQESTLSYHINNKWVLENTLEKKKPYFVDGKQAQENNPTACNTR
jgi:hypothetical protein